MNKKTNFSDREDAVKRCKDHAITGITLSSKPASSLAVAIAALTGCLMNSGSVQAAINVPTDMTASPLCINGQCASAFTAKMLLF